MTGSVAARWIMEIQEGVISESLEPKAHKQSHLLDKVKKLIENDAFLGSDDISSAFGLLADFVTYDQTSTSDPSWVLCNFGLEIINSPMVASHGSLRSTIAHRQIVEVHREYLDRLANVNNELDKMGRDVDLLSSDVECALKELDGCRSTNQHVLETAQSLQLARTHVRMKYLIASKLIEKLKVHDSTIRLFTKQLPTTGLDLESAFQLLQPDFFEGIEDVERVRRNAESLIDLVDTIKASAKESSALGRNDSMRKSSSNNDLLQEVRDVEATRGLSKVAANEVLQETQDLLEVAYEKLFFICSAIIR